MRLSDVIDAMIYAIVLLSALGLLLGIVAATVGILDKSDGDSALISAGIGAAALCLLICHIGCRRITPADD